MRSSLPLVLLAAVLAFGLCPASAQRGGDATDDVARGIVYVVTYFDALPSAAAQARELLTAYAAEGRHLGAPHVKAFRSDMAPLLGALYDDRLYRQVR